MFSPVPWPERKEFRTAGDEVFAPINRGPHRGGPLAEGIVAGRKVAGRRRAFGSDTVPGCYEDLEQADLVVLVGSNLAWCHPVLFQRLRAARDRHGTRVVVIAPRRTDTCDLADLHLALEPGADVALFSGLLVLALDRRSPITPVASRLLTFSPS